MRINIAIDGPSAAGKSTVSDHLAQLLGYVHLDTGAMYRLVAYMALKDGLGLDDEEAIVALMKKSKMEFKDNGEIYLNGIEVSDKIRTNEISMAASTVSKNPRVREALVALQKDIAKDKGYILDGRDIGTVVLKDAEVKIYLTASAEDRAKRRMIQNAGKGLKDDYEKLLKEIKDRDYQDMHRSVSPLKKADDAIAIDTSDLSQDEVVEAIYKIVKTKI